jgi:thiamine kinase-like enzyme
LHAGPAFANRFDIFAIQRRYLDIMRDNAFRLPDGYGELLPVASRMEVALAVHPEHRVPCHNDLLAANFLDDGLAIVDRRLRVLRQRTSRHSRLGNIAQENHLDDAQLATLATHYYGADDGRLVARCRLWQIASAYAWTLWGTDLGANQSAGLRLRGLGAWTSSSGPGRRWRTPASRCCVRLGIGEPR